MKPALAAAAAALLMSGCGSGTDSSNRGSGELVWTKRPLLIVPPGLPNDRILTGTVRNEALRRVKSKAKDVELRDRSGRRVKASVAFVPSFLHPINPPTREPQLPDSELRRLGRIATIDPGKTAPVVVSWHDQRGLTSPSRVVINGNSLPIPTRPLRVKAGD